MHECEETLRSSHAVKPINLDDYSSSKTDFTLEFHGMKKADTFSGRYSYSRKHTTISNNTRNNLQATSYNSTMQKGTDSPHSAGAILSLLTAFVSVNKIKHESISSNTLSKVLVLRTTKQIWRI